MNKKMWGIFTLLFMALSGFVFWSVCRYRINMGDPFLYLNGPVGEIYSPLDMMWWLWLFAPIWAFCGKITELEYSVSKMTAYRQISRKRWWYRLLLKIYGINTVYFVLFFGMLKFLGVGAAGKTAAVVLLIQMLHSALMITLMLWLRLIFRRLVLAFAALIILEAVSTMFVIWGMDPSFMPLVWGMFGYSSRLYMSGGFHWPVAVGIEIAAVVLLFVLPVRGKLRELVV